MVAATYYDCINNLRFRVTIIGLISSLFFTYVQAAPRKNLNLNQADALAERLDRYLTESDYQQQVNQLSVLSRYITNATFHTINQSSLQAGIQRTMKERDTKSDALIARISSALLKFYKKTFFEDTFKSFIHQQLQILSCEKTVRAALKERNFFSQIQLATTVQKNNSMLFFDTTLQKNYVKLLKKLIENYNETSDNQIELLIAILTKILENQLLEKEHHEAINNALVLLRHEKNLLLVLATDNYDEKIHNLEITFNAKEITVASENLKKLYAQALTELFSKRDKNNTKKTEQLITFYTKNLTCSLLTTLQKDYLVDLIQALKTELDLIALNTKITIILTYPNTKNLITQLFSVLNKNTSKTLNEKTTDDIIKTLESCIKEVVSDQNSLATMRLIANNLNERKETSSSLKNTIQQTILPTIEKQTTYHKKLYAIRQVLQNHDKSTILQELETVLAIETFYTLPTETIQSICAYLDEQASANILAIDYLEAIQEIAQKVTHDSLQSNDANTIIQNFLTTIGSYIEQATTYHELIALIKPLESEKLLTHLTALFVEKSEKPILSISFLKEIVTALHLIILKNPHNDDFLLSAKNIALAIAQQASCPQPIAHSLIEEIIPLVESHKKNNNTLVIITRTLTLENYATLLTELTKALTIKTNLPLPATMLSLVVTKLEDIYIKNRGDSFLLEALKSNCLLLLSQKNIDTQVKKTLSENLIPAIANSLATVQFNNSILTTLKEKNTRLLLKSLTTIFATHPTITASNATILAIVATLTTRTNNNHLNGKLLDSIRFFLHTLAQKQEAKNTVTNVAISELLQNVQTYLSGTQWLQEIAKVLVITHGANFIKASRKLLEENSDKILSTEQIDQLVNKIETEVTLDTDSPQTIHDMSKVVTILYEKPTISTHASKLLRTILVPRVQKSLELLEMHTAISYALSLTDQSTTLRLLNEALLKNSTAVLKTPLLESMVAMLQKTIVQPIIHESILTGVETLIPHLLNQPNLGIMLNNQLTKQIIPALQKLQYEHSIAGTIRIILSMNDEVEMLRKLQETFSHENNTLIDAETLSAIGTTLINLAKSTIANKKIIQAMRQLADQLIAHPRGELSMKNRLTVELLPELQHQLVLA